MAKINENYLKLQGSYLFSEIAKRVSKFQQENPQIEVIRLGIGDVTKPLTSSVIGALHKAVDEMGQAETFRGYGPEQGYEFLTQAIIENDYLPKGVELAVNEIFISDGSKCDTGNFQEIFGLDNVIAVTDPVYPVYVDTNVMAGRSGFFDSASGQYERIVYMPCREENNFVPELPVGQKVDLIYLCFPNNPTGMTATKEELKKWVEFAKENQAIILFDAAYEAYIQEDHIPHSIYEVEGAKEVAVEFRSFSKTAGFTGTRCAFTVVPKELKCYDSKGNGYSVNELWNRRHTTKFNGVSYIVQKAAQAIYSPEGKKEIKSTVDYYMSNAKIIRENLVDLGIKVYGGVNAPYIWLKAPNGLKSWEFFDKLLNEANVVGTPGSGFGPSGEGYFRLTSFGSREKTLEAMERFKTKLSL